MAVQLRVPSAGDRALIEDAYAEVFRPAFDTTELPSQLWIEPGASRLVVLALDEGRTVGGAVADTVPGSDIGLLSYMATRPDVRGQGVGAALLTELREQWSAAGVPLVLGEVRDPRAWERTESERPDDRLRFYARNGSSLVPVPWVQPAVGSGPREPGLLLLAVHGGDIGTKIEASRLLNWAAGYYADSEGREPSDAQYLALIARLGERDVETIPVDAYESVAPL